MTSNVDTWQPDTERRGKFVEAYFETGSLRKACKYAEITESAGQLWRKAKWFDDATKELKKRLDKQFDGRITKLLDKTISALEERVENGDDKAFHHQGEVITQKVPIGGKDLAVIAGVLFDKRNQLRDKGEGDTEKGADSALERIAGRLSELALADKMRPKEEVVDVECKPVTDTDDLV